MKKQKTKSPESKPIKELLQVLLDNEKHFHSGLCNQIFSLECRKIITHDEYNILKKFINNNPPFNINSIVAFITGDFMNRNYFYWNECNFELRKKWILKHIKKLSK